MTTYGNKYIFNFISQNGDEVEVCIQKKNYSGSFVRRPVGRGPVLKRERNGAILGTSLELYAECRIDQEYVELYTSSADEFRVLVYKNRELQWTGFVSPELYAEPDIAPPYDVQIIATDGLGELKNTLFDRPDESYPLGDHIDYILRKTGLSLSVDLISSLSWDDEAHNNSPSSLLSLTANLTHLASNSDYDVLQDILTSFNACITQQAGRWMIVRKTDIYNNIPLFRTAAFGSVNKTTWWPIGSLSADIVPAKRKLTLTHENNYKDSILPGLISGVSGGWEFATGVYYNDSEKAYILSGGNSIKYTMEFPVYPISVPLKLSINARPLFNSSEEDSAVLNTVVELKGTVNGVRGTYYLVYAYDDALGRAVWRWHPDEVIPLRHIWLREELPEDVEQEVTTVNAVLPLGDNVRPDRITIGVYNLTDLVSYTIAVYDIALAQNDQIRGLKLIAEVGNNARESVETSVVISSSADPMLAETMYGVLRLDGGITSWHTPYNAASDLLKFLAADYAMLTALPAIRYRGTLNVPAQVTPWIPFIFERDNTYYLLETYSYDLLLDELEVELVSIPNSRVSIESETIIEIPAGGLSGSGTVSGGGGSSSGGGSGEGDNEGSTLIVDSEMDDESENAVQNKVIKAYIDAGDNLIKEEIERLKQQSGADTPSSFYHDMAAIVSHAGMITRQTREQLYNIFSYTEDGEIPPEAQWVIDTNGQHYIVRMLETETGVGFFIIGYEGYTRIEGDNTKTNQLLRDKADKQYVDNTFFSQAQFDPAKTHDYVKHYVNYKNESPKTLELGVDLVIQDDIENAAEDDLDNGLFRNGLVTALGVKNWLENKNLGSTPDWLAQEGEDGYIENKTHGLKKRMGVLVNNGDRIPLIHSNQTVFAFVDGEGKVLEGLKEGSTYVINYGPPTSISVQSNYIVLNDEFGFHATKPLHIFGSYRVLSDLFIPNTIARVSDIKSPATPDWDAAEEESGYIKNRPFYTNWYYTGENIEVTSDTPVTISGATSTGTQENLIATLWKFGNEKTVSGKFGHTSGELTFDMPSGGQITFTKSYSTLIISYNSEARGIIKKLKLTSSVNTIAEMYLPSNLAKLDDGYVVAKGVLGQDDDTYYRLPNNGTDGDADHTLATEGYADLHPRYVEVENTGDIVFPEVEGAPKKMRLRFREGEIFVDSYEAISDCESVKLARLGRHSSRHTTPDDEEGVRVKKNGWRIYDHRTRKKGSSSYVLESIFLALHEERNGYKRYKVIFINKNSGQGMTCTPRNLMGCFGIVGDDYADVRKGHTRKILDEVNSFASQIYALVIDGVYLPFRLTAIRESDGMRYGGTPLNI